MNVRNIKKIMRSNTASCYFIYIFKYRLYLPFVRIIEILKIKWQKITGRRDVECLKIAALHNIKKGDACVIVGNGPSVRMQDLDKISSSGLDSFGANRIMDILDNTKWRPTYLTVLEPAVMLGVSRTCTPRSYLNNVERYNIRNLIFNSKLRGAFPNKEDKRIYYVNTPLALLFSNKLQPFSEDPTLYVSDLGNVTTFSIQLAVYMGYTTIYLYGMDNLYMKYLGEDGRFHIDHNTTSHVNGMKKYIDDEINNTIPTSKFKAFMYGGFSDTRKSNIGYKICKEYAEQHAVNIYNITRGGELHIFERKNFGSVFEL